MKKFILGLSLLVIGLTANAQNGLEKITVEKYYVSNAADAGGSIGALPVGSVTYRVYADMLPNYKFQAAYGVPGHEFRIATSASFFNNEDYGSTTPNFSKTNAAKNSVMLDSWFSVGAACSGNFGILKSEDDGVNNVMNNTAPQILQNNDAAAGIPLTTQDGLIAGAPEAVSFVGISTAELDVFDALSNAGNLFTTSNGSVASLNGSIGPDPSTNKVLIGQFTTNGNFSFKLNIQIGTPTGGIQNYVAENPTGNEILLPSLTYPATAAVYVAASPAGAICANTNVTFTASPVNGGSTPSYQWKRNGVNVGTNSPSYSSSTLANNDQVTCVMTSSLLGVAGNPATSTPISMVVFALPTATVTTAGQTTFCSGANPLTITANSGPGYSYAWKKGSAFISGATGISYIPTSTGSYRVVVTSISGCTKSSAATSVTVNPLPTATATAQGPTTFCSGGNVVLQANAGAGFTYEWKKGTAIISGATAQSYTATATGTYKVKVTNANGCTKLSAGVVVTATALPPATITPQGPLTFCAGDSVVFQANAGAGLTYQWKKGTNNISGATSQSYTAKTAGTYKVTVTNANGCTKLSGGKKVVINCKTAGTDINELNGSISIYPNPVNGPFTLEFNSDGIENGTAQIEIINVLGENVFTGNASFIDGTLSKQIDLGDKSAKGLYLVKVVMNDKVYNSRLILE